MGIRSEKRKVLQQIVNKDDSSLDIDPESLLNTGDLHWFEVVKPVREEKDPPAEDKSEESH